MKSLLMLAVVLSWQDVIAAAAKPLAGCTKIGTMKTDGSDAYSCPPGILEENVVGDKRGAYWYFNADKLKGIEDKVGINYLSNEKPTPVSPVEEAVMTPTKSTVKNSDIPVVDQYESEAYSEDVLKNKMIEYSAALWTLTQFKDTCQFGNQTQKSNFSGWVSGLSTGMKGYQDFYKDFQFGLRAIKPVSANAQLDALKFQINSLKLINRSMDPIFRLNNVSSYLNGTATMWTTGVFNSNNQYKKIAAQYQDAIELVKKNENECTGCGDLVSKLQNYSTEYLVLKGASKDRDAKLTKIEDDLRDAVSMIKAKNADSIGESVQKLMTMRNDEVMVCPASPDALASKAADFAKSIGIEVNQKNTDLFISTWKEIDAYIVQSYSRQVLLNRADRFVSQIRKWNVTSRQQNELQLRKLSAALKDLRVSLGMPAFESIEEAKANMSEYMKSNPDFIRVVQKTGGGNVWYMAEVKTPDGKTEEVDLMTPRKGSSNPTLCDYIIPNGCQNPETLK